MNNYGRYVQSKPPPSEDTQPNENVDKRGAGQPPRVMASDRGRRILSLPRKSRMEKSRSGLAMRRISPSQERRTEAPSASVPESATSAPGSHPSQKSYLEYLRQVTPSSSTANSIGTPASSLADAINKTAWASARSSGTPSQTKKRRRSIGSNRSASYLSQSPSLNHHQYETPSTSLSPSLQSAKLPWPSSIAPSTPDSARSPVNGAAAGPSSVSRLSPAAYPKMKRERSPSPVIYPQTIIPITEGSYRVAPIPQNCRPTDPNYAANRQAWVSEQEAVVKAKGVQVLRAVVRSDGLAIDWKSSFPVVPDTLLLPSSGPTPPAPRTLLAAAVAQVQTQFSTEDFNQDSLYYPPSPRVRPSTVLTEKPPDTSNLCSPQAFRSLDEVGPSICNLPPPSLPGHPNDSHHPQTSINPQSAVEPLLPKEEVQHLGDAALRFLERYLVTFDSDRPSLASAYAVNATFSVQIVDHSLSTPSPLPIPDLKMGCFGIIDNLLSLPDEYRFCSSEGAEVVVYDMAVYTDTGLGRGIMLTCYAALQNGLVGDRDEKGTRKREEHDEKHGLRWDQRFVLSRKTEVALEHEQNVETAWPLVAISHQITFRHFRS